MKDVHSEEICPHRQRQLHSQFFHKTFRDLPEKLLEGDLSDEGPR